MNNFNLLAKINPNIILKNIPTAIIVTDMGGDILWVNENAAALFESTKSTIRRQNIDEIIVNGLETVKSSVAKDAPTATAGISLNGEEFFVEISALEEDQKYYITVNDTTAITNFLSTAEKSGRLKKDKNEMIYKLSNELTSPIQAIQNFAKALLDGLGGNLTQKQEKYAGIIAKNATDYLYFMNKFIEFASIESMCEPLNLQFFDVVNSIQNLIRTNENLFNMKSIKVNFDADEITKRAIYSDENMLKIIMQNILEASIKLTDLGLIDIKLSYPDPIEVRQSGISVKEDQAENSFLKISVIDTGVGYTEADLEDLFDPYVYMNRSNKKNMIRTLGLGSMQNAVKALGGSVKITSAVMQGCVITVILPIVKE